MKTIVKHALGLAALLLAASLSAGASAAPVVVGSVNPDTKQVTIFQDFLVKQFQDGTAIANTYGSYDEAAKEFVMVRGGKSAAGNCQTDAFRLVRLSGNRLAIARDGLTRVPWNGIGTVHTLRRCLSETCSGNCQALGDPDTPFDLTDYYCLCTSASGLCEATLGLDNKLDDIVWQGPEGPL